MIHIFFGDLSMSIHFLHVLNSIIRSLLGLHQNLFHLISLLVEEVHIHAKIEYSFLKLLLKLLLSLNKLQLGLFNFIIPCNFLYRLLVVDDGELGLIVVILGLLLLKLVLFLNT